MSRGLILDAIVAAVRDVVRHEIEAHFSGVGAESPTLVDRNGLALALSCSVTTIDRQRAQGLIPTVMLGDSPRFVVNDVVDALRAASEMKEAAE